MILFLIFSGCFFNHISINSCLTLYFDHRKDDLVLVKKILLIVGPYQRCPQSKVSHPALPHWADKVG